MKCAIIERDRKSKKIDGNPLEIMLSHRTTLLIHLLLVSSSIGDVTMLSSGSGRSSGLYVDNGQDQTVIHRLTSNEAKTALEREILKLLGLPEKPQSANRTAPVLKRSAPNFLLNIYESSLVSEPKKTLNKSEEWKNFYLTGADVQTINQSDSIVTFSAQQKHQGVGGKPDRVKRIWFDVGAAPKDERMTSAELRLYRGPDATNRKNRGAFSITVYRVTRTSSGERSLRLADSINTTAGQEGWLTLNLTDALAYWMKNPGDNRGLYLSVRPTDRSSHETRPEDIGIVGFKGDAERQPFMVGFFESTKLIQLRMQPSLDEAGFDFSPSRKRETSDIRDILKNRYNEQAFEKSRRPCRINTLYVSFKDLQWQDWIIAPEGYDAYYCGGECKFPLNSRMNATNHAIIQALVHLTHPSKVPKPCCVPTQLSTISVLYFHDENNVVLKKYKNMAVRGCGCH